MALPKLNQSFNFRIKVPSFKKEFNARAYLTKEEKILLFAAESNDPKEFLKAIKQIILNCVQFDENYSINDLTTFDSEYMFLKLRSFSVGEGTNIKSKCSVCDTFVEHNINLNDIFINELEDYSPTIVLGAGVTVKLRVPTIQDIINKASDNILSGNITSKTLFEFLPLVIDTVIYNEEQFDFKSETKEEQEDFIEQLNSVQLLKIGEFVNSLPQVTLTHEFNHCDTKQTLELKGLQDFFS